MLSIANLTIIHKKDLTTLAENVSFSVSPGERLALIGEEGNGKSTLLRAILGDEAIDSYAQVSGRIVNTFSTGFLPQELPARCHGMSAYEFFCENEAFYDQTPNMLGSLCARLSLPVDVFYSEQTMGSFSGGERVKLQLARLLMSEPELLMDEPTRNLSPLSGPVIRNLFDDYPGCIIAVSHDALLISRVCTREARLTENGLEMHEI